MFLTDYADQSKNYSGTHTFAGDERPHSKRGFVKDVRGDDVVGKEVYQTCQAPGLVPEDLRKSWAALGCETISRIFATQTLAERTVSQGIDGKNLLVLSKSSRN